LVGRRPHPRRRLSSLQSWWCMVSYGSICKIRKL